MQRTVDGFFDYYSVLGLEPQASPRDIARAYRSLLRRHHPDTRPPAASGQETTRHGVLLQEVMEAHAVLADPIRRARYDSEHHRHPVLHPSPQPSATPFVEGPSGIEGPSVYPE